MLPPRRRAPSHRGTCCSPCSTGMNPTLPRRSLRRSLSTGLPYDCAWPRSRNIASHSRPITRMTHRNAPLTAEGRRRLIERCRTRPITHFAAEMGISRATASKWVNRYRCYGDLGLLDRSSSPRRQPSTTPEVLVARIESIRRERKWSASQIAFELEQDGTLVSRRTITRLLEQLGLNRRRFIERRVKPGAATDHCGTTWPHDPRRRQKGRALP